MIGRREFLRAAMAGIGAVGFAGLGGAAEGDARPNIILLVTDDALWNEFQFHNPKTAYTPTMQQLVDEGVYFTNCFAGGSSCSPARFALFTGRQAGTAIEPSALEAARRRGGYVKFSNGGKALLDEDNIARVMRDADYVTGIVGKTDGIDKSGGYHKIDPDWDPADPAAAKKLRENQEARQKQLQQFGFDHPLAVRRGNIQTPFATTKNAVHNVEHATAKVLEFLDIARQKKKPFFLVYATSLMHAPKPYESLTQASPLATEGGSLDKAPDVQPSRQSCIDRVKARGIAPDRVAAMLWLDDSLAAIMRRLKQMGVDENTLVALNNDNGHDNNGKDSAYYDGFHVPLVIRWPKGIAKPGRREERLVRSFDLVPTFMELAKARQPEKMILHGRSLAPLLRGEAPKDWRTSIFMPYGFARAVQQGDFRYIAVRYPKDHGQPGSLETKGGKPIDNKHKPLLAKAAGRLGMTQGETLQKAELNHYETHGEAYFDQDQLYNLKDDPLERKNLARQPEYAAKLKEMQGLLRNYVREMPGVFGEFKPEDPEFMRFLEAQGGSK